MQERAGQERPQEVDEEDQARREVECEAIVLVRRDLRGRARDGARGAERGRERRGGGVGG